MSGTDAGDPYFIYVAVAYGLSAVILAGLVAASVLSGIRARREVERLEKERAR